MEAVPPIRTQSGRAPTVEGMSEPVNLMTREELLVEANLTRAAWEQHQHDVGTSLETSPLPALSAAALRHQEVVVELERRGRAPRKPQG